MVAAKRIMRDERIKQVCIGGGAFLLIAIVMPVSLFSSGRLPGVLGESYSKAIGALTTPFIMETSFVILGFVAVVAINGLRRKKDGSDFVSLDDFVEQPAAKPDLKEEKSASSDLLAK
ncbi:MAG: hypothetical protein EAZ42_07450 [Verrucomicrobia bacterium]|nr:MAG: hypothetical protein EAZ42_07450 [Verrucomicrobiota bacterium]